eukprot:3607197-Ditylum_brightwellii.AAC.2
MEMVLVEHTSAQAAEMERNYKLQLTADKALVIKIFANRLPTSFKQKITTDSTAVNMEQPPSPHGCQVSLHLIIDRCQTNWEE